jgi:outer membrane protein TolC
MTILASTRTTALVLVCGTLAGCVSAGDVTTPGSGFETVSTRTSEASGQQTVWIQNRHDSDAMRARVASLLSAKSLDADTAVQVALLNNKALQAAYADLGQAAADAWQSTLLLNPRVSIGTSGIGTPSLALFSAIEGTIATNLLALATRGQTMAIADTAFRKAQLSAALRTLQLAAETRRAWIQAVAAVEMVGQLEQAQAAADAASELARTLGEAGSLTREGQAREHVFHAEITAETAKARLEARLAKEALTRLMGLWGPQTGYRIPSSLPSLPAKLPRRDLIEAEALSRRIDLQMAKLDLEATARSLKLTDATRIVTDLEIVTGVASERKREDGTTTNETTGQADLAFAIPIFDSGKARLRKAELRYMRAANILADTAVGVRSEARAAYEAYRSTYDIARHYRDTVLPLRAVIDEQSQRSYNGMITSTFELLADSRDMVGSMRLAVDARRAFWVADANLSPAIYGGSAAPLGDTPEPAAAGGE